jgi:hypothetical protein
MALRGLRRRRARRRNPRDGDSYWLHFALAAAGLIVVLYGAKRLSAPPTLPP